MEWLIVLGFIAVWCFIGAFLAGLADMGADDDLIPAIIFWPLLLCCIIGSVLYSFGKWIHSKV